jgi:hypothetical protein
MSPPTTGVRTDQLTHCAQIELATPGKPWKTRSGTMISQTEMDMHIRWRNGHNAHELTS